MTVSAPLPFEHTWIFLKSTEQAQGVHKKKKNFPFSCICGCVKFIHNMTLVFISVVSKLVFVSLVCQTHLISKILH